MNQNQQPKKSKKAKKPKVKRQLNNIQAQVSNLSKKVSRKSTLTRHLGLTDAETVNGFEHLMQSLFSGVGGIHRGMTIGGQQTALCRFKQVLAITVAANTKMSFAWAPVHATSSSAFTYSWGTGATTGQDPFNSLATVNVTSSAVPGPFNATNPSTTYRVVRAAMRITNTSNVASQGGYMTLVHTDDVYKGSPSASNLAALIAGSVWADAASFENFEIYTTTPGTIPMVAQWFPSDDEIRLQTADSYASSNNSSSGFIGQVTGSANSGTFIVELDYGLEYVATKEFRPFVDRALPRTIPTAYYHLTQAISKNWNKLVLTTAVEHDNLVQQIEHVPVSWDYAYQMANILGDPALGQPLRQGLQAKNLVEEKLGYCDRIENATGFDLCGGVNRVTGAVVRTAGDVLMNAYMPGAGRLPSPDRMQRIML